MKKVFFRLAGCAALALASVTSLNASAVTAYIKVNGSENIYVTSGTKTDTDKTITYNASTKTLTLNGYTGGNISTNVAGLKLACSAGTTATNVTASNGTSPTLSAAVAVNPTTTCSSTTIPNTSTGTTTTTTKNPDTLDPVVYYAALAVISAAALFGRKFYYAKRK